MARFGTGKATRNVLLATFVLPLLAGCYQTGPMIPVTFVGPPVIVPAVPGVMLPATGQAPLVAEQPVLHHQPPVVYQHSQTLRHRTETMVPQSALLGY
ncbi:MAG: hypothetical protein HQL56_13740 [Magnetococcales bacterium]|nr:hypothetical protein [Magnetococcales bacterium]